VSAASQASAAAAVDPSPTAVCTGSVLIVDDDELTLRALARALTAVGHQVVTAAWGHEALLRLRERVFDCVFLDLSLPDSSGLEVLQQIHGYDPNLPVALMTGSPTLDTAIGAVHAGARRYLVKPFASSALVEVAGSMVREKRNKPREEQLRCRTDDDELDRGLEQMYLVFQPIVSWKRRELFAYEALLRTRQASLPHPGAVIDLAQRCQRLPDLGRRVRALAAATAPKVPCLFVNLHPADLLDDQLYDGDAPLSAVASRVVLEVTEREGLSRISDLSARLTRLRALGFQIAVDDLGEGYAGLTSLARIRPEFVKLDMSLVREVVHSETARHIVRATLQLCRELDCRVVGEGVETILEREGLSGVGCDLLQGYLFGRPQPDLVAPAM